MDLSSAAANPVNGGASKAATAAAPVVAPPASVSHEAILIKGLTSGRSEEPVKGPLPSQAHLFTDNGSFTPRPQARQSESVSAVTAASGGTATSLTPGRRQIRAAAEYQAALRRLNEAAAEVAGLWHELQVYISLSYLEDTF